MGKRKRVKKKNSRNKDGRNNGVAARDRFSELPDALVQKILSLVPTIDAVRMSFLSKHWRNVWHSLPVLDLS